MFLVGSLFSLPYVILFYAVWIAASLARPLLVVTLMCVLSNPKAAWRKLELFLNTVQYLALCNDKTWKAPKEDPATFFPEDSATSDKVKQKTIIFIRHGESTWNDTFNKGDRSTMTFVTNFVPNLVQAALTEWYFWASGQANESWFYDAPLSEKGRGQALGVQKFLQSDIQYMTPKEAEFMRLLLGLNSADSKNGGNGKKNAPPTAQLVSSNLRRAISTIAIGLSDRLEQNLPEDKIMILPHLQEISRNPDALSITPAHGKVVPAWTDPKSLGVVYDKQIDTTKHTGNKPVNSNGYIRMQAFCKLVFDDIEKDAVVAAGHSLWFRSFFRTYLPGTMEHVSKKKKLINGGVVGFTLQRITLESGEHRYLIDPKSLTTLHGGF
jgi:hypothetical protein